MKRRTIRKWNKEATFSCMYKDYLHIDCFIGQLREQMYCSQCKSRRAMISDVRNHRETRKEYKKLRNQIPF
jgi:hypothetical protein